MPKVRRSSYNLAFKLKVVAEAEAVENNSEIAGDYGYENPQRKKKQIFQVLKIFTLSQIASLRAVIKSNTANTRTVYKVQSSKNKTEQNRNDEKYNKTGITVKNSY